MATWLIMLGVFVIAACAVTSVFLLLDIKAYLGSFLGVERARLDVERTQLQQAEADAKWREEVRLASYGLRPPA